jgi:imidazolonepropionase
MKCFSVSWKTFKKNPRIELNLALINIKQLVTVPARGKRVKTGAAMSDLGVLENAAVIIEKDTITWTGRMEDLSIGSLKESDVLDCIDKVVMPGFVDPHTHLLFAGSREDEFAMRNTGATYRQIAESGGGILSTVASVRDATKKDLKKFARRHLNAMMRQGTLTVEIKSGYGFDTESELKKLRVIDRIGRELPLDVVPTFMGAHAIPAEYIDTPDKYVDIIVQEMIPRIADQGLARFCDVFCEKCVFEIEDSRRILEAGKTPVIVLHVDHPSELSAEARAHIQRVRGAGEMALEIGPQRERGAVQLLLDQRQRRQL